ncbi:hypothetical protein JGS22_011425 [Streptomyces sp. P38-E01]|uniref:Uncharacterized protein n=1 Tax=Streptomyces tardus TaxID=2780544 RepID=A0A949JL48_9ACTN|nr:hypothetical protein [Streptomyces tardus]MBU7598209.1 hypothetical protein [Streptomyces tardus]
MGQHGSPARVFTPFGSGAPTGLTAAVAPSGTAGRAATTASAGAAASTGTAVSAASGEEYNPYEHEALAEIELYGELIIAAAAEPEERLSRDRIDEVLLAGERTGGADR